MSLAYVMFRDKNVRRNAEQSAAVFPSISPNYTKLAAVRRTAGMKNLGVYQLSGTVRSVGTYCEYTNRFFVNVSPSLDGLLFHQLVLAGGYPRVRHPTMIGSIHGPALAWVLVSNVNGSLRCVSLVSKQTFTVPDGRSLTIRK